MNTKLSSLDKTRKVSLMSATKCAIPRGRFTGNLFDIACTAILSFLFLAIPLNTALADCGPFGGSGDSEYAPCEYNPLYFSKTECRDLCEDSEFCMPYQDEKRTIFKRKMEYFWASWWHCSQP
jgi:hypothetical protein